MNINRAARVVSHRPSTPAHCCAYFIALFAGEHSSLYVVVFLFLAECRELYLDLTIGE